MRSKIITVFLLVPVVVVWSSVIGHHQNQDKDSINTTLYQELNQLLNSSLDLKFNATSIGQEFDLSFDGNQDNQTQNNSSERLEEVSSKEDISLDDSFEDDSKNKSNPKEFIFNEDDPDNLEDFMNLYRLMARHNNIDNVSTNHQQQDNGNNQKNASSKIKKQKQVVVPYLFVYAFDFIQRSMQNRQGKIAPIFQHYLDHPKVISDQESTTHNPKTEEKATQPVEFHEHHETSKHHDQPKVLDQVSTTPDNLKTEVKATEPVDLHEHLETSKHHHQNTTKTIKVEVKKDEPSHNSTHHSNPTIHSLKPKIDKEDHRHHSKSPIDSRSHQLSIDKAHIDKNSDHSDQHSEQTPRDPKSEHKLVLKCLQKIPDSAIKCYKQYQEHLQFIESLAWMDTADADKRTMFCCALWDWRKCVSQMAHFKCEHDASKAIETFEPLIDRDWPGNTTYPLCVGFSSGSNHCQSLSGWVIMAMISCMCLIIIGLYWVLKKDRGRTFDRVPTIKEMEEADDSVFTDDNRSLKKSFSQ